ncbi:hypothetical protein Tco_0040944 [Tanacetum coccineum]
MVINSPCLTDKKELAIPGQTKTGKEFLNPLMADSLPKTILSTKISKIDWLLSSEVLFEGRPIMSICSQAMNGRICYIKSMLKESIHLGISKEVGTLRYLNLVAPLTKVGDEAVHKELGDRMERVATTASSLKAKQDSDAQTRFEAASKSPMIHLSQEVKHLEDQLKSITKRRKVKVAILHKEEDLVSKNPSKQGMTSKTKYGDVETKHAEEESFEVHLDVLKRLSKATPEEEVPTV